MIVIRSIAISSNYRLELVRCDYSVKTTWGSVCAELFGLAIATALELIKWLTIALFAALFLTQCVGLGHAAPIPRAAEAHKATLIRTAHYVWGMDAPIAVFAAQIHAESRWNPEARSPVGALGMAQFMPATARWIPEIDPELAQPAPTNPGWAIRAMLRYDLFLWDRTTAGNSFERMAFTLSGYNGGQGWVNRDKRLAARSGYDPLYWFNHVERVNAGRNAAAFRENRNYPRVILNDFQHRYASAGWGPGLHAPE